MQRVSLAYSQQPLAETEMIRIAIIALAAALGTTYSTISPHRVAAGSALNGIAAGYITSNRLRARTRELTHGHEPTREAAMAAFAKSWRRK